MSRTAAGTSGNRRGYEIVQQRASSFHLEGLPGSDCPYYREQAHKINISYLIQPSSNTLLLVIRRPTFKHKPARMPKTILGVDITKAAWEQSPPLHNRWHPDIPPVATVQPGEVFRVETIDWTGGQIKNDDSADDVKNVDLTQVRTTMTQAVGVQFRPDSRLGRTLRAVMIGRSVGSLIIVMMWVEYTGDTVQ